MVWGVLATLWKCGSRIIIPSPRVIGEKQFQFIEWFGISLKRNTQKYRYNKIFLFYLVLKYVSKTHHGKKNWIPLPPFNWEK